MSLDRRGFLSAASLLTLPQQLLFAQAQTDRRFIFIIQRGAADGLNTVIPYADPAYTKLRGALAIDPTTALKLDERLHCTRLWLSCMNFMARAKPV